MTAIMLRIPAVKSTIGALIALFLVLFLATGTAYASAVGDVNATTNGFRSQAGSTVLKENATSTNLAMRYAAQIANAGSVNAVGSAKLAEVPGSTKIASYRHRTTTTNAAAAVQAAIAKNPGIVSTAGTDIGTGYATVGSETSVYIVITTHPAPVVIPKAIPAPAPVQQAPVQQAPVQQAPVQQAPVQQAPVQQAPVQQAPAPEPEPEPTPTKKAEPTKKPTPKSTPTKKPEPTPEPEPTKEPTKEPTLEPTEEPEVRIEHVKEYVPNISEEDQQKIRTGLHSTGAVLGVLTLLSAVRWWRI